MHAKALISQLALFHNLSVVKQYAPNTNIVTIIKANAYGHHINLVHPLINQSDLLGVNDLSEAKKLRAITNKPILLLSGFFSNEELQQAISLNCIVVVHNNLQIPIINSSQHQINVWLKIDTGMHHLGFNEKEFKNCLTILGSNHLININCIMSHFACADTINHPMNTSQLNLFNHLTKQHNNRSMANSAAILSIKNAHFEYVRPGIMLYGVSPFAKANSKLKPVMQLLAPVKSIKTIQAGESVGYGSTWSAKTRTQIAIIDIGYADGYPRHAKNGTPVLINNTLCSLAGRVSMYSICVDIGNTKVNINDTAILWGDTKLPVETIAKCSNTIGYELLTGIGSRVEFISTL